MYGFRLVSKTNRFSSPSLIGWIGSTNRKFHALACYLIFSSYNYRPT
jgi:hypothetical protein